MRDIKALAFVCVLIAACATTDGGGGDDGSDPPPTSTPVCGDAVCAASEVGVCSQDCGTGGGAVCGNGQCESTETNATCPGDCTGGGGGTCPADPTECFLCILDATLCMNGLDQTTCQACILMP